MTVGGVGLNKTFRPSEKNRMIVDPVDNLDLVLARFLRGEFDLVGVGRSLLNDPEWTRRVRLGLPATKFDSETLQRLY